MLAYWLLMAVLFVGFNFLLFLGVWVIAKTDTFFGFIKEGQGAIIKRGESFDRVLISLHGHRCDVVPEKNRSGQTKTRWKIYEGVPEYSPGILGILEKRFGIYWFGFYPFVGRMMYKFRWNEWEQLGGKDGSPLVTSIWHREEGTNFFYAQTFNYALILEGAETGGTKDKGGVESGGNLSVDLKITLLLRIIYPQVAILQNENWFDQLGAVVLDHARLYVGSHTFDKLRSQEDRTTQGAGSEPVKGAVADRSKNEFCEYIMGLNRHAPIGETSDSIIDAFGVKIVGAQILSVELAGDDKKELAGATTSAYVAQEKAIGMKKITDAEAYDIAEKGRAEAGAIEAKIEAIKKHGDVGRFVTRQDAVGKAGAGGNVIIFTSDREPGGLNEETFAGLILNKNKGGSNGK